MRKTLTKSEIRRQAQSLEKRLRKLYNELDNLMDEANISSTEMGEPDTIAGKKKKSDFDMLAHIIGCSRDHCEMAYDELQSV